MRLWLFLVALLLPLSALAEPITVAYTEPAAQAGVLAETRIYWCKGTTCTNFTLAKKANGTPAIQRSDDGNGGDAKSIGIEVPLNESELPLTVRVAVTSISTSGNEITKTTVSDTHTFSAP